MDVVFDEKERALEGTDYRLRPDGSAKFKLIYVGEGKDTALKMIPRIQQSMSPDQPGDTPTETGIYEQAKNWP